MIIRHLTLRTGAALAALLVIATVDRAQTRSYPKAKVSFGDFKNLVAEAEIHREKRLVSLDSFLRMAREPGTIILDARSDVRFERLHLKGARHLSFPDFTSQNLERVVPGFQTRILIYCNNNFDGNQTEFPSKVAEFPAKVAIPGADVALSQMRSQGKPIMLALNIPTYITLYGYGYRNVYELDELVNVADRRILFEGTIAAPLPPKGR